MILIDMEMPKRCEDCRLRHRDHLSVIVTDRCSFNWRSVDPYTFGKLDRPGWCPLKEPKPRESRAMLPCKCGCNRREHWFAPGNELCEELRCKKCGFTIAGKNQIDAIRRWNEAVKPKEEEKR